jgi:hypothetical protein
VVFHFALLYPVVPAHQDHTITRDDIAHVGTNPSYATDSFGARDGRERWFGGIVTGDGKQVHWVDWKRLNLDHHFIIQRRTDIVDFDTVSNFVWYSEKCEPRNPHWAGSRQLLWK